MTASSVDPALGTLDAYRRRRTTRDSNHPYWKGPRRCADGSHGFTAAERAGGTLLAAIAAELALLAISTAVELPQALGSLKSDLGQAAVDVGGIVT